MAKNPSWLNLGLLVWDVAAICIPILPGSYALKATKVISNAIEGGSTLGKGFNSFKDAKKFLGPAGEGNEWHHIVEQSQIKKSGFGTQLIQNTDNLISIDKATHAKISGYYNSIDPRLSDSMRVRNWLAGQSFETQYQFGMDFLSRYGVKK